MLIKTYGPEGTVWGTDPWTGKTVVLYGRNLGMSDATLDIAGLVLDIPILKSTFSLIGGAFGRLFGRAETTTLRLPASMADELPIYRQAANDGLLTKVRSSELPGSNARSIWESSNGPVPEGFDVDHIIQRQFGGTDELSNLQLKLSGLNRSQGAQSMWLNKAHPYGTVFDSVELFGP
jgi:hypothetical protein